MSDNNQMIIVINTSPVSGNRKIAKVESTTFRHVTPDEVDAVLKLQKNNHHKTVYTHYVEDDETIQIVFINP